MLALALLQWNHHCYIIIMKRMLDSCWKLCSVELMARIV